jgi:hypothetical protein
VRRRSAGCCRTQGSSKLVDGGVFLRGAVFGSGMMGGTGLFVSFSFRRAWVRDTRREGAVQVCVGSAAASRGAVVRAPVRRGG